MSQVIEGQKEKFFIHWVEEIASKKRTKLQSVLGEIKYAPPSFSQMKSGKRPVPEEIFNALLEKHNLYEDYKAYVQSGFATFSKANLQLGTDIDMLHRVNSLENELADLRRQMNNVQEILLKIQKR